MTVRAADAADRAFLEHVLAIAADWRAPTPRAVDEVLRHPDSAHYVTGWPAPGDFGLIAETDDPVGAAWWRYFSSDDPGYGFVDEEAPEISIGVVPEARGEGVGTRLLQSLIRAARDRGLVLLSLSVDADNPALSLYVRLGFERLTADGGSLTLVRPL